MDLTLHVTTRDGRSLQVIDTGGDGLPCLYHGGTPSGAVVDRLAVRAARDAGLRWITYSRPGYGDSTALPGRDVASVAADVEAILDHVGVDTFVTYGLSGGGPHALATAALMPSRCLGVASIGGVAPAGAEGLDFLDGMAEDNVEEFGRARSGEGPLVEFLSAGAASFAHVTGAEVVAALGGLVSPPDQAALTGEVGEYFASSFREALRTGIDGWRDDDLAFVKPWGFELADLRVPVAIWQGGQDLMVPPGHGRWLAAHIPGARAHLHPEDGHLSLGVANLPVILTDLRNHARS